MVHLGTYYSDYTVRLGAHYTVGALRTPLKTIEKYFGCTFWVVTNGGHFDVRPPGKESLLRPCTEHLMFNTPATDICDFPLKHTVYKIHYLTELVHKKHANLEFDL